MRKPKPIKLERLARPETHRIAWTCEPYVNPLTGLVQMEEKKRARETLEAAIVADGYSVPDCEISWQMIEAGWGWVARVTL